MLDTTYQIDPTATEFTYIGKRLFWYKGDVKSISNLTSSHLYAISDAARKWDGLADEVTHCIGNRFGSFGAVIVRITGRKLVRIPGTSCFGTRCSVVFNADDPEYRQESLGWVV